MRAVQEVNQREEGKMKTVKGFEEGERVTGTYFGHEITGTVKAARAHTINPDWQLVHVALTTPLTFNGSKRDSLHFDLEWDGSGDYGCSLRSAA